MSRTAYRKINGRMRRVKIIGKGKHAKVRVMDKAQKSTTIKPSKTQVGKSDTTVDMERHAKRPGLRRTKWGSTYFENRRNRSDKGKWL